MATPVLIPISEYLNTTYHPDCDYIDGQVKERNLGEKPHSTIQSLLAAIFFVNRKVWGVRCFTEQRVQVAATRFRIPDVCLLQLGEPPDPIIYSAPLLCVEIFSRDDSRADIQERVDDYLSMGVRNIWLFDPARRLAWSVDASGSHTVERVAFSVSGTQIRIQLADLYAELDELAAGR